MNKSIVTKKTPLGYGQSCALDCRGLIMRAVSTNIPQKCIHNEIWVFDNSSIYGPEGTWKRLSRALHPITYRRALKQFKAL